MSEQPFISSRVLDLYPSLRVITDSYCEVLRPDGTWLEYRVRKPDALIAYAKSHAYPVVDKRKNRHDAPANTFSATEWECGGKPVNSTPPEPEFAPIGSVRKEPWGPKPVIPEIPAEPATPAIQAPEYTYSGEIAGRDLVGDVICRLFKRHLTIKSARIINEAAHEAFEREKLRVAHPEADPRTSDPRLFGGRDGFLAH